MPLLNEVEEIIILVISALYRLMFSLLLSARVLNAMNIPLSVETVCVFTAPIFSAFASWATYLLTKVWIPATCHIFFEHHAL